LDFMELLLHNIRYDVLVEKEDDEYIGTIGGLWFVESSDNTESLMIKLATILKKFAIDYYRDLHLYRITPNFKKVFPMITKALVTKDVSELINYFNVEYKEYKQKYATEIVTYKSFRFLIIVYITQN